MDDTNDFGTSIAFISGCGTSILSGFIGMKVAVYSNYRTAFLAQYLKKIAFIYFLENLYQKLLR